MAEKKSQDKPKQTKERKEETYQRRPADEPVLEIIDESEEGGTVRISEDVISAVVKKYTLEVDGVTRFASNTIVSGLAEMIGRRSHESNVVVDLSDEGVNIAVTLVLEFGVKIPEVAALVQDVIRTRVEAMTGKHVNRVDVIVQDLEETQEPEPEVEETEATTSE